jgi:hypothetical protein
VEVASAVVDLERDRLGGCRLVRVAAGDAICGGSTGCGHLAHLLVVRLRPLYSDRST